MVAVSTDPSPVTTEFVAGLADRAAETERLRRLPAATLAEATASGLFDLLVPARYGVGLPWRPALARIGARILLLTANPVAGPVRRRGG